MLSVPLVQESWTQVGFVHFYDRIFVCERKVESERENVLWLLCVGGLRSLGAESGAML